MLHQPRTWLVLLCLLAPLGAHATRVGIAAVVGDDIITSTDVAERRDLIMATAGIPATVENQAKLTPRIVQSLVDEALELQEAKRQSLVVSDDEVGKAIEQMSATRPQAEGTLKDFITQKGLSMRSLENQMRAQLAWAKVVQRKLRRNVTISQDEILRAQQSAAAAPGEDEIRLATLAVSVDAGLNEAAAKKLSDEIALQLKAGTEMPTLAARYIKQPQVQFSPPVWVAENAMQPALQQTLRSMKNGEVTPPLQGGKGFQFIQMLDRKTLPKQADATEFAIKQILIPVPPKRDKVSLAKLRTAASTLRSNPGDCMSETLPATGFDAKAKFVRTHFGAMTPEQRAIVNHLEVGDISEPLMSPEAVRLVMLCEKIEPSGGNVPQAEEVRKQLFAEKLELEAQKLLRNLRRDAYIDIKGDK
ncbi:MAG: SurA N-terminal domain-containing protein [Pseudomonadota bacterium]